MAGFAACFADDWVADRAADWTAAPVAVLLATLLARAGAARVAEAAWDLFRATGAVASDVFPAEPATRAWPTLPVGSPACSGEPLPVAFFPPVVFAIAIPPLLETGLPGKNKPPTNR